MALALPALISDRMASDSMESLGSDVQADDSNDITSGSQLMLLQLSTEVSRHRAMANWSGGVKGWLGRFPKLEMAANGATHAKRCVAIWKALAENHWMQFVDGRGHAGGPHVFENTVSSHGGRASGKRTFENQDHMYDEFSRVEAWESRWTVDKLAALNAFYYEVDCHEASCNDRFDYLKTAINLTAYEKKCRLTSILAEYYNAIDAIQAPMSDRGGGTHIQHALPYIAVLYQKLALLHPFLDGNSRVRTMVLQTELVRQGGHPAVLWDNYWGIYDVKPEADLDTNTASEKLQEFVLDGWCGWEIVYNTKASPFSPYVEANGILVSTPHSEYNAGTAACEEGPGRSFWQVPFDKNHPD